MVRLELKNNTAQSGYGFENISWSFLQFMQQPVTKTLGNF